MIVGIALVNYGKNNNTPGWGLLTQTWDPVPGKSSLEFFIDRLIDGFKAGKPQAQQILHQLIEDFREREEAETPTERLMRALFGGCDLGEAESQGDSAEGDTNV